MKWGADMPGEMLRWLFVERYGWSLADVDALTMQDLNDWYQIQDGRAKAG